RLRVEASCRVGHADAATCAVDASEVAVAGLPNAVAAGLDGRAIGVAARVGAVRAAFDARVSVTPQRAVGRFAPLARVLAGLYGVVAHTLAHTRPAFARALPCGADVRAVDPLVPFGVSVAGEQCAVYTLGFGRLTFTRTLTLLAEELAL